MEKENNKKTQAADMPAMVNELERTTTAAEMVNPRDRITGVEPDEMKKRDRG
ncbi:hypothetical protein JQN58_19760 [Aneurinibacillus sp. BA2021]|nr:hypothetical protein [Aneurinibacillus sp. BA2021]